MAVQVRNFKNLKAKQRAIRSSFPEDLGLRIHRALSWLEKAEYEAGKGDEDGAFIFLWIAFNAAYAGDLSGGEALSERASFREYFKLLQVADRTREIYGAIWEKFSGPIRELLKNPYVFAQFWAAISSPSPSDSWKVQFERSQEMVNTALVRQDTPRILEVVFDRLYVLRNQLVHGGATWKGAVNRDQVRDGGRILGFFVPLFIDLMMDSPEVDWGRPSFPVVHVT